MSEENMLKIKVLGFYQIDSLYLYAMNISITPSKTQNCVYDIPSGQIISAIRQYVGRTKTTETAGELQLKSNPFRGRAGAYVQPEPSMGLYEGCCRRLTKSPIRVMRSRQQCLFSVTCYQRSCATNGQSWKK